MNRTANPTRLTALAAASAAMMSAATTSSATPAVLVAAYQERYHSYGVWYGIEPILYPAGALTETQIAALIADPGLIVSEPEPATTGAPVADRVLTLERLAELVDEQVLGIASRAPLATHQPKPATTLVPESALLPGNASVVVDGAPLTAARIAADVATARTDAATTTLDDGSTAVSTTTSGDPGEGTSLTAEGQLVPATAAAPSVTAAATRGRRTTVVKD